MRCSTTKVISELLSLIDRDALERAVTEERRDRRIDSVLSLIRDAIAESSLGVYSGKTYYFGGRIYEEIGYDEFGDMVYELMRKCGLPLGDFSRIEGAIKVCRRKLSTKRLRVGKRYVVFENCVVDTETREELPFSKDIVQMSALPYSYDCSAKGYIWDNFLEEVLPNKMLQLILKEFLGSLFVDRCDAKMETLMILKGSGSNGKSVVFETVLGVLGKDSVSNFGLDELIGGGMERKRNIASINGKRLNYCSETKKFAIDADSGILKALISGEPIEARAMYGENFRADSLPQIMINANSLPILKDWSYGMRRRLRILPFDVEIPPSRQRKGLSKELRAEYPYIFNWMLDGRDRFVANGYKLSDSVTMEKLMDEYQSESSPILRFMEMNGYLRTFEMVEDASPYWIASKWLYVAYKRWCKRNGEYTESLTKFGRTLAEAGYRKKMLCGKTHYAIFGKKAIGMLRLENRKAAAIEQAEKDKAERIAHSRFNAEEREEIEKRLDGRCAFGSEELAEYFGISTVITSKIINEKKLEGTYEEMRGTRVFLLDLVDELFFNEYIGELRKLDDEKERKVKEKAALHDYKLNGIE